MNGYHYRRTPRDAWGINPFKEYLHDLTAMKPESIQALCKWLDISLKTMQRYISGETHVPRAICYALYHESQWGKQLAYTEAFNDRQIQFMQINELKSQVRNLETNLADTRRALAEAEKHTAAISSASNDATYGIKREPRNPHAFTAFKLKASYRRHQRR
ncbi:hypothetical protein [Glaciimonas soli]|uniref:Uncharacterized protein n=1 Tax=Glaciimonas soli TaxID=2590999 RepID=A0A843YPL6_9BURK|nr:hypothetical protein [Glaciimonas soli]MQQ99241.1 hypothetical protein [Glaciimonas soli]